MCGIIFGANIQGEGKEAPQPVGDWIINQFEDQYARGTNGFGLVFVQKNGEYKIERACEPYKMIIDIKDKNNQTPIILMHHRTPTSSQNKIQETHPILVDNKNLKYKYLGVHNGIVSNDTEIKEEHEKSGFVYTTQRTTSAGKEEFNDTECLIIELARYIENHTGKIATQRGGSFVLLQIDKKTDKVKKVFYGRTNNSFPLNMAKNNKKVRISSEGEGNEVAIETLYSFGINDFKIEKRKLDIKEEAAKGYTQQYSNFCYGGTGKTDIASACDNSQDDETDGGKMETMVEEIYEKIAEKNEEITSKLDLYAEERDLIERIEDQSKIMEIDAKKEALNVSLKVYNAIKSCQANFLEGMIKEEKICSIFPQSIDDLVYNEEDEYTEEKDIGFLTPKQGTLISTESTENTKSTSKF